MSDWMIQLLALVVPFLVGAVSKYAWDGFEKLPLALDKVPSIVKPLAVAVVAWGVGLLGTFLQTSLPGDIHLWTADTVHTVIAAAFAWVIHLATKKPAPVTA